MNRLLALFTILLMAVSPVFAEELFSATVDQVSLGMSKEDVLRAYPGKLQAGQHPVNAELADGMTSFLFRENRVFSMRGCTAQTGGLELACGDTFEAVRRGLESVGMPYEEVEPGPNCKLTVEMAEEAFLEIYFEYSKVSYFRLFQGGK